MKGSSTALLTTITVYWGRPDVLRTWLSALKGATVLDVEHIIYFVQEDPPDWWGHESENFVTTIRSDLPFDTSIGHYHNEGARLARTRWIMKLDIDTIPNVRFFTELLSILPGAKDREWFNCGMFYMAPTTSTLNLIPSRMPLDSNNFTRIVGSPKSNLLPGYQKPAGTNFICNRNDYLNLGGCLSGFQGYGWEDYQQIYMLEKYYALATYGRVPLPGVLSLNNVTQRCRDEISRRKAQELYDKSKWLVLLHRWHPPVNKPRESVERNRRLLLDYITGGL